MNKRKMIFSNYLSFLLVFLGIIFIVGQIGCEPDGELPAGGSLVGRPPPCLDADEDGFFYSIDGEGGCDSPEDCDDDDKNINPGAVEICGNDVDENCDGNIENETDGDGICPGDNCPDDDNGEQADSDGDGIGDVCDECRDDPDNDIDNDGICGNIDNCPADYNPIQEDADSDYIGDACEKTGCENNPDPECTGSGGGEPEIITASFLDPTGCETYIGRHPDNPEVDHIANPSYEVTYTFCDDNTVEKGWNADPKDSPDIPGYSVGTGTWGYDGDQLTIQTVSHVNVMGMAITNDMTEVYDVAFTYEYDGGKYLDLNGAARTDGNGSSVLGTYTNNLSTLLEVSGRLAAIVNSTKVTTIEVTEPTAGDGFWEYAAETTNICSGSDFVCGMTPATKLTETAGEFVMPGVLFAIDSKYVFGNPTLVFERQ